MSRPSRIYAFLNPLMRMTSIESAMVHLEQTHQRREEQQPTGSGQPRRGTFFPR